MAALIYFAPSCPKPVIAFGALLQLKSSRTSAHGTRRMPTRPRDASF